MPPESAPTSADIYDGYYGPAIFVPWAEVLLDLAAPRPGERALDLACGTGIVTRRLAPRLGPAATLVGLDLRDTMLAAARGRSSSGGGGIGWLQGNALALPARDRTFTLVVCQQGLQFFADRVAALREVRRVLGEGGRAAFAVWQDVTRQGVFEALVEAEIRHLAPLGITADHANAPFVLGDPEELRALFERAGFQRIQVLARALDVSLTTPDRFVSYSELAYAEVMPEYRQDPSTFRAYVEAIERDVGPVVRRYTRGDRLVFPMHAHLVLAQP